jgi:uncharacterized protein involved in exopolysaccharide biosynthesis
LNSPQEEINLLDYIKIAFNYRVFLVFFVGICLCGTFIYNQFTPKVYTVRTTFFLPIESENSGSALLGYAQMFGASLPSNLGDYVKVLIESNRIKERVLKDLRITLKTKVQIDNINKAKKYLALRKSVGISEDKVGIFELSVDHCEPQIALEVAQSYLKNILLLNQELEISAKKEIITILDEPLLPIDPSKPRKLLNLIISIFLSGIIGIFTVLIYDYIKKGLKTIK